MSAKGGAVLVTGATSGIGLACTHELARVGYRVFAGYRTDAGIAALTRDGLSIEPVRLDITDPASIATAVNWVTAAAGSVGLTGLVNNAGVAFGGPVEHVTPDHWRQQFDVNVFGQIAVTQAFLPLLRSARGCIIIMGSIGGRISVPLLAPYSSSKAALESIADALRAEVEPFGVRVVVVEPGAVATPMWVTGRELIQRIRGELPSAAVADYGAQIDETIGLLDRLESNAMSPAAIGSLVAAILGDPAPRNRYAVTPTQAEQPTTATRIAALSPERRRLLELLRRKAAGREQPAFRSGERQVSCSEERLLFIDELAPGNSAYNVPAAMRIRGPLDAKRLEEAVGGALGSFDAFRTSYMRLPTGPLAITAETLTFSIPLDDVSDMEPDVAEARMRAIIDEEVARPFDLTTCPLVRCRLVRLAVDDHVLIVVVHHIVCDGWSLSVVLRAIGGRFADGEQSAHEARSFSDVVAVERRALAHGDLDGSIGYWVARLRGAKVLDLPTDRPRPSVSSGAGGVVRFMVSAAVKDSLALVARTQHTTLFSVLLAAFALFLQRYTDCDEVTIGTPVANRSGRGLGDVVGFLVNTLVWRLRVDPNLDFATLLDEVRLEVIQGLDYQDAPFDQVVEGVNPVRRPGESPLFRVMFVLQNVELPRDVLPGLTLGPVEDNDGLLHHGALTLAALEVPNSTTKFDLTLQMEEVDSGLAAALEFDRDLFDDATVERMARHLTTLLESVAAGQDGPVGELSLLSEDELAVALDQTAAFSRPVNETFIARFQRLAERFGDHDAVVDSERITTYTELDRYARCVAGRLARLGVEPGTVVGVCLERSAAAIAAVLGVLEAGCAFLPLEASLPVVRRREQLGIACAGALVTTVSLVDGEWTGPVVLVDDVDIGCEEDFAASVRVDVPLDSLAYVIFTSGSTGVPKGVMVEHHSLANALRGWEDVYGVGNRIRRHLQVASFSFDVWVGDLVRALGTGDCLVLCPTDAVLDPERLHQLLDGQRIDFVEIVPVVARLLVDHLERVDDMLHTVEVVAVGSDVWHSGDHERLRRRCPDGCLVVNSFGLTEATIDNAVFAGPAPDGPAESVMPIGYPLPNSTLYVLDRARRPVPTGVRGELYVGGECVARGYIGRPDLTSERFLPDPFSRHPGARMYRTGDLARRRSDGAIECLGRIDRQVKVNGIRVELGEVECVVASHSHVATATVVPRALGSANLVAYVTAAPGAVVDVAELSAYAAQALPRHARPSRIIVLDALPVTPSGKVDLSSLPPVDDPTARLRTPLCSDEQQLVGHIWQDVLDVDEVWLDDDFFELGGHSLLLNQVANKLTELSGRTTNLRTLLEYTTVRELAAVLAADDEATSGSTSIARTVRQLAVLGVDGRGRVLRLPERGSA